MTVQKSVEVLSLSLLRCLPGNFNNLRHTQHLHPNPNANSQANVTCELSIANASKERISNLIIVHILFLYAIHTVHKYAFDTQGGCCQTEGIYVKLQIRLCVHMLENER